MIEKHLAYSSRGATRSSIDIHAINFFGCTAIGLVLHMTSHTWYDNRRIERSPLVGSCAVTNTFGKNAERQCSFTLTGCNYHDHARHKKFLHWWVHYISGLYIWPIAGKLGDQIHHRRNCILALLAVAISQMRIYLVIRNKCAMKTACFTKKS